MNLLQCDRRCTNLHLKGREVDVTHAAASLMVDETSMAQTADRVDTSTSVLPVWVIIGLTIACTVAVVSCVTLFYLTGNDWWILLRDPAASYDFVPWAGVFSHLGVLALTITGAILVFAAVVWQHPARERPIMIYAGLMSLWLALDDLFMLHEGVFPRVTGAPEIVLLGTYVVLALGLMRMTGPQLFTMAFLGFWVATAFLAVMVISDQSSDLASSISLLVEDGSKLCGYVVWSAFWIAYAARAVTSTTTTPQTQRGLVP
jgi:hypothetical protein